MSKISLEKFIEKTKGTQVDVPWATKPSRLKGQCVSLVQAYIKECLEQPAQARGNAKDWIASYVNEGLGSVADKPQKGDILVYGEEKGNGYGHIAICIDENTMYDQNNLHHDNGCAGYTPIASGYTVLRPNVELIEEPKNTVKYLNLSNLVDTWRVYPMNVAPIVGNECKILYPNRFDGLSYTIKGYTQDNVAIIDTRDYGQVQIYIGKEHSNKFSITNEPIYGLVK